MSFDHHCNVVRPEGTRPVAVLSVNTSEWSAVVCAWHGRYAGSQSTKEAEHWCCAHGLEVTHGMCPECREQMIRKTAERGKPKQPHPYR